MLAQSSLLYLTLLVQGLNADYAPGKVFDRFITIWLENQDFMKTTENPDIQNLTKSGVLLTSYYALTHPSQPNYIASVGGDYFGLNSDGVVEIPENVSSVVDLFDAKDVSWKLYLEGLPSPGFQGTGAGGSDGKWDYQRKHNPLVSYKSISNNQTRLNNIQSLDAFTSDLVGKSLPQWSHISPNMDDDGHNTSLSFAASWSKNFLEPLLLDEYFMNNTLVLLTYDETETYDDPNRVAALLLGGAIPEEARGTTDDTFYSHYSMISTLENNWGLPNLGRYDVGANVFQVVANKTGYQNQKVNVSGLLLNQSYPGFLNTDTKENISIPSPNLSLTGAGGQGILPSIKQTWAADAEIGTPYNGSARVYDGWKTLPVYTNSGKPSKSTGTALERRSNGLLVVAMLICSYILLYIS